MSIDYHPKGLGNLFALRPHKFRQRTGDGIVLDGPNGSEVSRVPGSIPALMRWARMHARKGHHVRVEENSCNTL